MCVLPPPPSSSSSITPSPLSTGSMKNSSRSVLIIPAWKKKHDSLYHSNAYQSLTWHPASRHATYASILHLSDSLKKEKKERRGGERAVIPPGGPRRDPEWHLASKMANTRAGDETVPLPSSTNTSCQVIPHVPFAHTHTAHISWAQTQTHRVCAREQEWGRRDGGRRRIHRKHTHTHTKRSCVHIHGENRHWENCPSLSLIPSVCLRQLVITKATHCCRGKRTHTDDREAFERKRAKEREW